MSAGIIVLCLAYVLSQFYRAFLAVLSEPLSTDIGVNAEALAFASGLWFITFALCQIPVGWALDHIGPRKTASILMGLGAGGGAILFAFASGPFSINAAMILIGIGCSPVLMASYFIFAREYPPARFATLAALMLGIGSLGNLLASYPMAWAAETFGWRLSLGFLGASSIVVAFFIGLLLRDPARIERHDGGSLFSVLRMPALWLLMPMMLVNYAPTGAIRGLWIGPYFTEVFGLGPEQIGIAGFIMGAAMILGSFAYGPLDRVFGTRKWVVFVGSALSALSLFALAFAVDSAPWISTALFASAGFFGACFPMIVAHGRAFFPPHLAGRGVTIMNLFGIGGVGIAQFVSGRFHGALALTTDPATLYAMLFAGLGALVVFGLAFYAFSRDNMN